MYIIGVLTGIFLEIIKLRFKNNGPSGYWFDF